VVLILNEKKGKMDTKKPNRWHILMFDQWPLNDAAVNLEIKCEELSNDENTD